MIKYIFGLMLTIVLASCSQDEEPEIKKVLEVITQPATNINPIEATLNGKVLEIGSTDITDHGFFISEKGDFPEGSTTKYSLGPKTTIGDFSIVVDKLTPETTYYYKAYANDNEGEVLASIRSFGTIAPNISGVEPAQGSSGEVVIISGVNFVPDMKVLFGDVEAEITELTETTVGVIVPKGLGITSVTLTILIGGVEYSSLAMFLPIQGKWEEITSFPGVARNFALSFTIGDKAYLGLGFGNDQYLRDMWEYDPSNDSWKQLNDFPEVISETFRTSFAIDGVGYVGIGSNSNEFWQYDAQDDLWLRVADFPSTQIGFGVNAFVIDRKAYVGRRDAGSHDVEFWVYYPLNNNWTFKTIYSGGWPEDSFHVSTEISGYLGLGAGRKQVWKYAPSSNEWEQMNDFPVVNSRNEWPTAFYVGGKVYAGITEGGISFGWDKNFWQYDEPNDSWIQLSDFPFDPTGAQATMVVNGNAYIGLGGNGSTSFYKFTPPSE